MDPTALVRLLVAAGLTAVIGIDRELRSKPAGLRTNIVVGISTAAFAYTGAQLFADGDPSRVASQVVSGIGFLGGGAIFAAGGKPHGLTTAAALWSSAAIGLAAGVGAFGTATALVLVTFIALWPLDLIAERLLVRRVRHDVRIHLVLDEVATVSGLRAVVQEQHARLREVRIAELQDAVGVEVLVAGRREQVLRLIEALDAAPGIRVAAQEAFSDLET